MKYITFDKLKNNLITEFCSLIRTPNSEMYAEISILLLKKKLLKQPCKSTYYMIKNLENEGVKIIENWDIRNVFELIKILPKAIPSFIKNNNYIIDYSENGWVFFNTTNL